MNINNRTRIDMHKDILKMHAIIVAMIGFGVILFFASHAFANETYVCQNDMASTSSESNLSRNNSSISSDSDLFDSSSGYTLLGTTITWMTYPHARIALSNNNSSMTVTLPDGSRSQARYSPPLFQPKGFRYSIARYVFPTEMIWGERVPSGYFGSAIVVFGRHHDIDHISIFGLNDTEFDLSHCRPHAR